jgi:hypothetical protein
MFTMRKMNSCRKSNGKPSNNFIRKTWENMMADKCYTKGVLDSNTKQKVVACRYGNYFGPENCYIDYVEQLPFGTCYVDSE